MNILTTVTPDNETVSYMADNDVDVAFALARVIVAQDRRYVSREHLWAKASKVIRDFELIKVSDKSIDTIPEDARSVLRAKRSAAREEWLRMCDLNEMVGHAERLISDPAAVEELDVAEAFRSFREVISDIAEKEEYLADFEDRTPRAILMESVAQPARPVIQSV